MSRRMSSWWMWTLSVAWSLLFVAPISADPPKAEPAPPMPVDRDAAQIQIDAVIYEVDPAKLAETSKSPVAELLKANGFELSKDSKERWPVTSVRDEPLSLDLEHSQIGLAFKRVASPTIVTLANQKATFLSGGEFPVPVTKGSSESGTKVDFREFGTKLTARPRIEADGQISLDVRVEESTLNRENSVVVSGIEVPGLNVRRMNAAAKLKSGQYLLIASGTTESDLTQFVQLKVRVLTSAETAAAAIRSLPDPAQPRTTGSEPRPASPMPKGSTTLTVEDRWPINDIQVGQRVTLVPVAINKSSLSADLNLLQFTADGEFPMHVTRIEPLPNQAGRRVTVTVPPWIGDEAQSFFRKFEQRVQSASTNCVIPVSALAATEIPDPRVLNEIVEHIPTDARPRSQTIVVGEIFLATGIGALLPFQDKTRHEIGPLAFELLDDDAGGIWRVTAVKPGVTRLIQHRISEDGDTYAPARWVEYLVKADTRELEHHLREQFPTAQVTITSVGANSLLLRGTVSSDEDSRGIAELAEQFAPNILNRLKVGTTEASAEPRRMGTPARPVFEHAGTPQSVDGPILAKPITAGSGKSAQPPRVKPASATSAKKADQLRELLDEIRELRQDVRRLNERLEREQAERTQKNKPSKASSPVGQEQSATEATEFDKLVAQYNELMDQKRFADAEVIGKQAKELDSKNPAAKVMVLKAVLDRRMAHEKQQQTLSNNVPLHNPEWARASSASPEPLTVGIADSAREAVVKLHRKVELEAVDLPLRKAVQQLSVSADINIVLDKLGLEEVGASESTPVTRTLKEVSLRSALKIVLDPLQLDYVFDGEVLKITSRARAEGPAVVVAYPVGDLLGKDADNELARLRDLIMVTVRGEAEWNGGVHSSPKIHGDRATKSLVVRHTSAVQAEVATVLELLRKTKRLDASSKEATTTHLSDEERRIVEQLQTKISVHFENAPLRQVAEHIAKHGNFNVVLDADGLADEGLTSSTPVSLHLDQVRTSTALRLLLEPLQLDYVVQHDVLRITSRARADGESVVATYPVADLLWRENDVAGDLSNLCDLLMSMVEPNSWENVGGGASVRANVPSRSLVVRQTQANHARIRELLETLKKTKGDRSDG